MKILFLIEEPADGMSPGSRFRIRNFLPYFEKLGIECDVAVSKPPKYILGRIKWRRLFNKSIVHKVVLVGVSTFLMTVNRLRDLLKCRKYDIVFMQRELLFVPVYPFLEKLFFLIHPRVIFEFDDAIFINQPSQKLEGFEKKVVSFLTMLTGGKNKIRKIIEWSNYVIVANQYLFNHVSNIKDEVTIIPTPVDTNVYTLKDFTKKDTITIGWSGQQANLPYLMALKPALEEIGKKYSNVKLKIICNPTLHEIKFENIPFEFHEWKLETEIEDLQEIDIGLMPLPEDEWTKGKCSLKLLQYMALGIVSVGTDFGYNQEVIEDGVNGFLAYTDEEWIQKLSLLINDYERRIVMGKKARETVRERYSIEANIGIYQEIFERVMKNK